MEGLEYDAYSSPPESGELILGHALQRCAVNPDVPGVGTLQSGEQHQKGGFAGTRRAHYSNRLPFLNLQRNAFENMDPRFSSAQAYMNVFDFNCRGIRHSCLSRSVNIFGQILA